jgi:hypothetical protein
LKIVSGFNKQIKLKYKEIYNHKKGLDSVVDKTNNLKDNGLGLGVWNSEICVT